MRNKGSGLVELSIVCLRLGVQGWGDKELWVLAVKFTAGGTKKCGS